MSFSGSPDAPLLQAKQQPPRQRLSPALGFCNELLKELFDIKYGEILFQGTRARTSKTVWYAKITDKSEDPISGIVAWFTSFGWDVEVIDLRS